MSGAPFLLRDPLEHVRTLYEERQDAIEGRGWCLADVYRELGGGSPRSSELHDEFRDFFNGQARAIAGSHPERSKFEYWAGIPERGDALRREAIEILARNHDVRVDEAEPRGSPDPQTRALVLAHNQIDAELHAHFGGVLERDSPRSPRPSATPRGAAVCVLGMSRSGTSLTARVLNILGVDLGPEDELMEPVAANNPSGFWEHKDIADLNEDILATLGDAPHQAWRHPPPLEPGWESDPRLEPHRRAARTVLQRNFAARALWGWKDPRTCLTLPFWQGVLAETAQVESRLRYVICVRHPLEVAASLEARDEMPPEESLRLWLRYTSDAIVYTSGRPRVFVSYEGYFPAWEERAARLATFLTVPAPTAAQREAIGAHVDRDLWHQRAGTAELSAEVSELYAPLFDLCAADPHSHTGEARLDATAHRIAEQLAQA